VRGAGQFSASQAAPATSFGYAVGLDMTRRDPADERAQAGQARGTWGRALMNPRRCAPLIPASVCGLSGARREFWLKVNGEVRQKSDIAHLIWSVPEVIQHLSRFVNPVPGGPDLYRHAPEGVGPVTAGDVMEGPYRRTRGPADDRGRPKARVTMAADLKLTLHGYYRSSASFRRAHRPET